MKVTTYAPNIFSIANFLTEEECAKYIRQSEERGYSESTITSADGPKMMKDMRNNTRSMYIDEKLAVELWPRVQPFVPHLDNPLPCGLNEMFRYYKYEAGQEFKMHVDFPFVRNEMEASYYTLIIYLNDGF